MKMEYYDLKELLVDEGQSQTHSTDNEGFHLNFLWRSDKELKDALTETTKSDFTRKYAYMSTITGQLISRNIVTIACIDFGVSERKLNILLTHVVANCSNIDFTEAGWYYWQPIHFAAHQTDTDKIRTIIDIFKETNQLNSLTLFSENALHVLLEYGIARHNKPFDVQLSNSWESRICQVIAEEEDEVVECAKLLIDAGIDVNHNNIWNETPLIIAIRYKLLKVIALILRTKNVDIDTCRNQLAGKSARDLLRENKICMELLKPNSTVISPVEILFAYLKNGEEDNFLRYNNENIRQYVNGVDGSYGGGISGTMLQTCLVRGFTNYQKEMIVSKEPEERDIMKTRMLNFFCHRGLGRCIEHLLNNNANIGQGLLHMAVKLNYYPFIVILLEHRNSTVTEEHILNILNTINESSFSFGNPHIRHVLFLLINKLDTFYNRTGQDAIDFERRNILNNILDLYLRYNGPNEEYKENICQIIRLGASLCCTNPNNDQQPSTNILKQISCDTLQAHLDDCINTPNVICYDSLIREEENIYSEIHVLHSLTHDPKKIELLNHPVLVYLIHAKWKKARMIFYSNIIFHFLFLIVLYYYMIKLHLNAVSISLNIIYIICLLIFTFKELAQLVLHHRKYFYDLSNYLELYILGCCCTNLYSKGEISMILAILLSTFSFLLMLGQMPKYAKYMIIFSSTKYFLEYALFYFIQFFSFALCFFILLPPVENPEADAFGRIMLKLFETLFFFIGQYDGEITSPPGYPIFGRAIVAIFIFCMTIIMNNLLVGLIVTDMDAIQQSGKQLRKIKMIKSICKIETFLDRFGRMMRSELGMLTRYNVNVFEMGSHKILEDIADFDEALHDHEKEYVKEILCNRSRLNNVLKLLYEYICSNIYPDSSSIKMNRNVFLQFSGLEDRLKVGRPGAN